MNRSLFIAPCGMNCGICMAYLRNKNKCFGCMVEDKNKPITRARCKIKNCETYLKNKKRYCFQCKNFPCKSLKHLDKRYRTKYKMSMIENLENIKEKGIIKFLENEKVRWSCPNCRGIICVHTRKCVNCGKGVKINERIY